MKIGTALNWILLALLLIATRAQAEEKKAHTRSWIGGEFLRAKKASFYQGRDTIGAFPAALQQEQKAGIFVKMVPTNSPLALAGIQAGDLILNVNGQAVVKLSQFYAMIDAVKPGDHLQLIIWREGEKKQMDVTTGQETFEHVGTIAFGLFWYNKLDLWPNPDFSIFVIGYHRTTERTELHSPESEYLRAVEVANGTAARDGGRSSDEGWRFWILPFNLSKHRKVLTQEAATVN